MTPQTLSASGRRNKLDFHSCWRDSEKDGITHGPDGEVMKRFGFHTFRHSLATCLMDVQENPAVVQAIMRHSKMDMTLYYSHSRRSAKRAAQEKVLHVSLFPRQQRKCGCQCGCQRQCRDRTVGRELVCYHGFTANQWALNSAVECHLHTVEVTGSNPVAPTILIFR